MIHTFPGFAKGKRAPEKRDSVRFGNFLTTLPTAPIVDLAPNFSYPMDGNDTVGDCVVAGWDHFRQVITGLLTGTQKNFSQNQIWDFYKTQNPNFDPNGNASTNGPGSNSDNGMNIQTFLSYLQRQKFILGFASIDYTNEAEMRAAVWLGLGVITGVVLDEAQMGQFQNGVWDNVSGSPVDGGHCIPLVGYINSPDDMTCITWAKAVQCTRPFILKQMDEAWFILMQEHVDHPSFRNHFDIAGFSKAVSAITNGKINIPMNPKPKHTFAVNLFSGVSSPEVLVLQQCLNYDPVTSLAASGVGSIGKETQTFGMLTKNAVQRFQHKYSIPETGYVGPLTRAQLNALFGAPLLTSDVIIQVESEGDVSVTGDENIPLHAYGCMQIRQPVCDDVNKHFGTKYVATQMLGLASVGPSIDCFNKYMQIYCPNGTEETMARTWNGGPNGPNESATLGYWERYQQKKASLVKA